MNGSTAEPKGLPEGSYTRETLPPPRREVAELLEEVRRDAEALKSVNSSTSKALDDRTEARAGALAPSDHGKSVIHPTDKGKRTIRIT